MFATDLYRKIVRACEEIDFYKDIPDISDLRAIVETAFWASLREEEGRPLTFAIVFLPKNSLDKQGNNIVDQIYLRFEKALPLTVETIVKLAGAFDPTTAALIAAPLNEKKTDYEIWGALFFVPSTNLLSEIPISVNKITNLYRPPTLMVTAVSPGSLLLTWCDWLIGRFVSGEFTVPTPTPFMKEALGGFIRDLIKRNEGFDPQSQYWRMYTASLEHILIEASKRGHGGTIILIPNETIEHHSIYWSNKYSFEENLQINPLLNRTIAASEREDDSLSIALTPKYSERLDLLAQLACVDGALILSSQLNVISFGSTLKAPKWTKKVILGPDADGGGGDEFDLSKLGTRHNSVVDFIGASAACVGFVLSQDGPIRGVAKKDEDTILCWPDCRISLDV